MEVMLNEIQNTTMNFPLFFKQSKSWTLYFFELDSDRTFLQKLLRTKTFADFDKKNRYA